MRLVFSKSPYTKPFSSPERMSDNSAICLDTEINQNEPTQICQKNLDTMMHNAEKLFRKTKPTKTQANPN